MKNDNNEPIVFQTKPEKCNICNGPVYRILYGEPSMPETEYYKTYHEHVIYGGCCLEPDMPDYECKKCHQKFIIKAED